MADEYLDWLLTYGTQNRNVPFQVHYFQLGADVDSTVPTTGFTELSVKALECAGLAPTFLMVGTIEPRKCHKLVLDAFDKLWKQDININLVIVGKQGWLVEELIERLNSHTQAGTNLHWLACASDESLSALYDKCTCLIAASEGEGFGLPLIEAAKFKLPILARDIPVFREVAAGHASYFTSDANAEDLARSIHQWLQLFRRRNYPSSDGISWITWNDSAAQITTILQGGTPYKTWSSNEVIRFWGNDLRLKTQVGRRHGHSMHSLGKAGFLVFGPYRPLRLGQYKVVLSGTAKHWSGKETFDISWSCGNIRLLHVTLTEELLGKWQKEFRFSVHDVINDFESRLWITDESDLSLSYIEFINL